MSTTVTDPRHGCIQRTGNTKAIDTERLALTIASYSELQLRDLIVALCEEVGDLLLRNAIALHDDPRPIHGLHNFDCEALSSMALRLARERDSLTKRLAVEPR